MDAMECEAIARVWKERDKLRAEVEQLSRANAELALRNAELEARVAALETGN